MPNNRYRGKVVIMNLSHWNLKSKNIVQVNVLKKRMKFIWIIIATFVRRK